MKPFFPHPDAGPDYVNPRFTRFPASALRTAPHDIPEGSRLRIESFDGLPDTLPNQLPRPRAIKAVAAFRVGDFHAQARVEDTPDGPVLAVEAEAYDLLLNRPEGMVYGLSLISSLYAEMGRQYVLVMARRAMREGLN